MKPTKSFRILTHLIMALFILSLFSGIVAAKETAAQQYEKANEIYKKNKDQYDNNRKKFEEAKDIFERANKQLGKLKDEKSKDELKQKSKDYLLRAIDFAQSQLKVMKSRVENSEKAYIPFNAIAVIDGHTAQLELLKGKVEKANTTQEFREVHKELKTIVVDINLETRYYMGIVLNHRIDNFTVKADDVSKRLDSAIEKLKAKGNDTTQLEKEAADFKDYLNKAKESQKKTNDLYKTHDGFANDGTVSNEKNAKKFLDDGNKLQRDTIRNLRQAGNQVIKFVKDLRRLVVKGGITETLTAGGVVTTIATTTATATQTATSTATPTATVTTTGGATTTNTATG